MKHAFTDDDMRSAGASVSFSLSTNHEGKFSSRLFVAPMIRHPNLTISTGYSSPLVMNGGAVGG